MAGPRPFKTRLEPEQPRNTTASNWAVVESCFPEAILLHLSQDGSLIGANTRADRLFAVASGSPILDRIRLQDRAMFTGAFKAVSRRRSSYESLIVGASNAEGVTRFLRGWMTPAGEPLSGEVLFAAQDATPLHEERERLGGIIEGSTEGIVVHRNGRILYANPRMAELVGLESTKAVLQTGTIDQFVHPDDRDRVRSYAAARLAGKDAPRDYEFRIVTRDGKAIWVDCRAGTVTWGGEPALVAACFDITEQKKTDQARQETEMLFRRVFDLSPDIVTLTRFADGRYEYISQSFLDLLGFGPEEVIGKTSEEIGIWSAGTNRKALVEALQRDETVHAMETQVRRRDGTILDLAMSATVLDFRGEPYILMVSHDITERKRQRQELIESKRAAEIANRTKSEFLANISHELRTPLNAVIGFAELMHSQALGPLGNPQYLDYSGDILDAGRHLLSIINDILDLSKLEAGRLSVSLDRVDAAEIITSCSRLVGERAESAGLTLDVRPPKNELEVFADSKRLKQALINLLANAIKFTPEGGKVRLKAKALKSGRIRFTVSDTGIGMSEDELEKALTPFGQIDSSLARRYDGAGLGLPLVTAMVEIQHGTFNLKSTPGRGTVASIDMPPPPD